MRLFFGPVFHEKEPQVATSTADVERRRAEARRSFREAEVAVEMKQQQIRQETDKWNSNGQTCNVRFVHRAGHRWQ